MKNPLKYLPSLLFVALIAATIPSCGDDEHHHDTGVVYGVEANWDADPLTVGEHTLTLSITDPDDQPVTGAHLIVTPTMPMHGHGSNVTAVVSELDSQSQPGVYSATPIGFTMAGMWEIEVTIHASAGAGEHVFNVDVQ